MFVQILYKNSIIKIINYLIISIIIFYLGKNSDLDITAQYFFYLNLINFFSLTINYGFSFNSQDQIPKIERNKLKLNNFISEHLFVLFINFLISILILFFIFGQTVNLLIIWFVIFFYSLNIFFTETLRALKQLYIAHFIFFNIILFCYLTLIYLYLSNFKYTEITFPVIFLLSNLIGFFIFAIYIKKKNIFDIKLFKLNRSNVFKYYKKYIYNFFNTISFVVISYFFTFLLFYYSSSADVVKYNISFLLGSIFSLPLIFLNNVYARDFSIFSINDKLEKSSLLSSKISKISVFFSLILILPMIIFLYLFSEYIFSINFNEYIYSFLIFWFTFLINNIFGPNEVFLYTRSQGRIIAISNILSFCIIALFLVFIIENINFINCSLAYFFFQLSKNLVLNYFIKLKFDINLMIFNK